MIKLLQSWLRAGLDRDQREPHKLDQQGSTPWPATNLIPTRRGFLKSLLVLPFVNNLIELVELEPAKRIYAPIGGWVFESTNSGMLREYYTKQILVGNFFKPNPLFERLASSERVTVSGGFGVLLLIVSRRPL